MLLSDSLLILHHGSAMLIFIFGGRGGTPAREDHDSTGLKMDGLFQELFFVDWELIVLSQTYLLAKLKDQWQISE